MKLKCYLCDNLATSSEHIPAKGFFPKNKRINLITVPSCKIHNEDTSLDDEYLRNLITSTKGTNKFGENQYREKGIKSLIHSPSLANVLHRNPKFRNFIKNDETTKNLTFRVNKERFDKAISKIACGLYYYKYKSTWNSELLITTEQLKTDKNDIDDPAKFINMFPDLKKSIVFEGENQEIFRYYFNESFNRSYKILIMSFYENFEVFAIPTNY